MDEPGVAAGCRHRCEPDLPVDPVVVGRDDREPAVGVRGLRLELIGAPAGLGSDRFVVRPLEDDLVPLPADAPERAVGVYEIEGVERRVHRLAGGEEVPDGPVAQDDDDGGKEEGDDPLGPRRLRLFPRPIRRSDETPREEPPPDPVVEACEGGHDRQVVQEGEVAREDQEDLEGEEEEAGDPPRRERTEREPRRDELDEVVPEALRLVEPGRQEMEQPRQRVRDRLRLVVVEEAGEVAPAGVAPDLDQPRAEHDPDDQPPQADDDRKGRRPARERPRIEEGTEEDREETGLEELDLPAVAVPDLSDVDEREVEDPERGEEEGVREAREDGNRQADADPGEGLEGRVRGREPEEARQLSPGGTAGLLPDRLEVAVRGEEAAAADQRQDLVREGEEREEVDEPEEAQDDEAREPVLPRVGGRRPQARPEGEQPSGHRGRARSRDSRRMPIRAERAEREKNARSHAAPSTAPTRSSGRPNASSTSGRKSRSTTRGGTRVLENQSWREAPAGGIAFPRTIRARARCAASRSAGDRARKRERSGPNRIGPGGGVGRIQQGAPRPRRNQIRSDHWTASARPASSKAATISSSTPKRTSAGGRRRRRGLTGPGRARARGFARGRRRRPSPSRGPRAGPGGRRRGSRAARGRGGFRGRSRSSPGASSARSGGRGPGARAPPRRRSGRAPPRTASGRRTARSIPRGGPAPRCTRTAGDPPAGGRSGPARRPRRRRAGCSSAGRRV